MEHLFSKISWLLFFLISARSAGLSPNLYFHGLPPYFIASLIAFYWTLSRQIPKTRKREIDVGLVFGVVFFSGDLMRIELLFYYFISIYFSCDPNLLFNLAVMQSMMLILDRIFVGRFFILFLISFSFVQKIL